MNIHRLADTAVKLAFVVPPLGGEEAEKNRLRWMNIHRLADTGINLAFVVPPLGGKQAEKNRLKPGLQTYHRS